MALSNPLVLGGMAILSLGYASTRLRVVAAGETSHT